MELLASCVMKMCLKPLGLGEPGSGHNSKKCFVIEKNLVKLTTGHRGQKKFSESRRIVWSFNPRQNHILHSINSKLDLIFLNCFILVGSEDTSGRDEVISRRV